MECSKFVFMTIQNLKMPNYNKFWKENYCVYECRVSHISPYELPCNQFNWKAFSLSFHIYYFTRSNSDQETCKNNHLWERRYLPISPRLVKEPSVSPSCQVKWARSPLQSGSFSPTPGCYLHLTSRWPWLFRFKCAALL